VKAGSLNRLFSEKEGMLSEKLLRMREIAQLLSVTPQILRNWSKDGFLKVIKSKGGHRRFKLSEVRRLMKPDPVSNGENNCLLYCRVSTTLQKENLKRERLTQFALTNGYVVEHLYEDIASGMNFKRKGILNLFQYWQTHPIKAVIIEYKDRIASFGVDLLADILRSYGTELLVVNPMESDYNQEIIDDLSSVILHFSSRLYGKRKGIKKAKKINQQLLEE
jgi:excisionase family DNA binding protein